MSPPAARKSEFAPGSTWGSFRMIERIGQGASSEVWLARRETDLGFAKLVALKFLRPDVRAGAEREREELLVNEAQLLSRLSHPHVVEILDVVRHGDRLALVMEWLEGHALGELPLPRPDSFWTPRHALRVVHDALLGLHYVHQATDHDGTPLGLIHHDVSPANLFIEYSGRVKVLDFGIARLTSAQSGALRGRLRYMAPERLIGDPVTPAADLYSMGIVLWEQLMGHPIWPGASPADTRAAILAGKVDRPESVDRSLPEELSAICLRALSYSPRARFESAAAFAAVLTDACDLPTSAELGKALTDEYSEDRARSAASLRSLVKDVSAVSSRRDPPRGSARVRLASWALVASVGIGASLWFADRAAIARRPRLGPDGSQLAGTSLPRPSFQPKATPVLHFPSQELPGSTGAAAAFSGEAGSAGTRPVHPAAIAPGASPAPLANPTQRGTHESDAPKPSVLSCDPPYVMSNGIKRFKIECLRQTERSTNSR